MTIFWIVHVIAVIVSIILLRELYIEMKKEHAVNNLWGFLVTTVICTFIPILNYLSVLLVLVLYLIFKVATCLDEKEIYGWEQIFDRLFVIKNKDEKGDRNV